MCNINKGFATGPQKKYFEGSATGPQKISTDRGQKTQSTFQIAN